MIFGVKVLGVKSKNGRVYSPKALAAAARLYEGIEVNIDHPDRGNPGRERGIRESFGVLKNATVRDDGVYADLHYVRAHDLAEQIAERAERFPDKLGLSHNARGHVTRRAGLQVVEDIELVRSVDLVTRPATVKGLFESQGLSMKHTLPDHRTHSDPDSAGISFLVERECAADFGNAGATATPSDVNEQMQRAFRTAVIAAFDDETLDADETLARIKDVLSAHERHSGGTMRVDESNNPEHDTEGETVESLRIVELESRLALMESEKEARALLEAAELDADAELVEAVALLETPAKKRALIRRLSARGRETTPARSLRPATSRPMETLESAGGDSVPEFSTTQSVVSFLRGNG